MYEETIRWRKEVDIDQLVKPKAEGGYDFEEREIVAALGWKMCKLSMDTFDDQMNAHNAISILL